jgi:hypothetical protein
MVVTAAEADAEAKYLAGTGIARQRQAIMNGLRESVIHFHADVEGINAGQVMEMMMMTQARSIHWFPYDRVGVVNADP